MTKRPESIALTGVRTTLEVPSFPALRPRLCIFLQMSGHQGEATFHVAIDQVETGEEVIQTGSRTIVFKEPAVVVPAVFRIRNCVFPAPGLYYVQVFHERKLIGERSLHILQEV